MRIHLNLIYFFYVLSLACIAICFDDILSWFVNNFSIDFIISSMNNEYLVSLLNKTLYVRDYWSAFISWLQRLDWILCCS